MSNISKIKFIKILPILLLVLALYGCNDVTISKDTPALVNLIQEKILILKTNHLKLIDQMENSAIEKLNNDYENIYQSSLSDFKNKNKKNPETEKDYIQISIITIQKREKIIDKIHMQTSNVKNVIGNDYDTVNSLLAELKTYLYSTVERSEANKAVSDFISKASGINLNLEKEIDKYGKFLKGVSNEPVE